MVPSRAEMERRILIFTVDNDHSRGTITSIERINALPRYHFQRPPLYISHKQVLRLLPKCNPQCTQCTVLYEYSVYCIFPGGSSCSCSCFDILHLLYCTPYNMLPSYSAHQLIMAGH